MSSFTRFALLVGVFVICGILVPSVSQAKVCPCPDKGTTVTVAVVTYGQWDHCKGTSCSITASYPPLVTRFSCGNGDTYYCLQRYEQTDHHNVCAAAGTKKGATCVESKSAKFYKRVFDDGGCPGLFQSDCKNLDEQTDQRQEMGPEYVEGTCD